MTADPISFERRFWVYKAYAKDGTLLYVGYTSMSLRRRLTKHRTDGAVWLPLTETVTFNSYPDEETARAFELDAIRFEAPLYNKFRPRGSLLPSTPVD
jgi:predicted GIY-YIG superfamily endonuclease